MVSDSSHAYTVTVGQWQSLFEVLTESNKLALMHADALEDLQNRVDNLQKAFDAHLARQKEEL